jgi:hypothetical protein
MQLTPLNTIFFGWVAGLIRRDGRQFSDLLACTALVYSWTTPLGFRKGHKDDDCDLSIVSELMESDEEDEDMTEPFYPARQDTQSDADIENYANGETAPQDETDPSEVKKGE